MWLAKTSAHFGLIPSRFLFWIVWSPNRPLKEKRGLMGNHRKWCSHLLELTVTACHSLPADLKTIIRTAPGVCKELYSSHQLSALIGLSFHTYIYIQLYIYMYRERGGQRDREKWIVLQMRRKVISRNLPVGNRDKRVHTVWVKKSVFENTLSNDACSRTQTYIPADR